MRGSRKGGREKGKRGGEEGVGAGGGVGQMERSRRRSSLGREERKRVKGMRRGL